MDRKSCPVLSESTLRRMAVRGRLLPQVPLQTCRSAEFDTANLGHRPQLTLSTPYRPVVTGSIPASDPRSLQRLLDISSEDLLRAVLEFDPVEMTIGVANVFARVCNSVAPLNVTLLRTVSGS